MQEISFELWDSMILDDPFLVENYENNPEVLNYRFSGNMSFLDLSARAGYDRCIRTLVRCRADINSQDRDGDTCLYYAISRGYCYIVQLLLELGLDTTIKNHNGLDALNLARQFDSNNNIEIVGIIIKHNESLDVDAKRACRGRAPTTPMQGET